MQNETALGFPCRSRLPHQPDAAEVRVIAEEMLAVQQSENGDRTITLDADQHNANLRDLHDDLIPLGGARSTSSSRTGITAHVDVTPAMVTATSSLAFTATRTNGNRPHQHCQHLGLRAGQAAGPGIRDCCGCLIVPNTGDFR